MGYMFPSSRVASGNYSLRAFVNPSSQTELSLRASPTIVTATVWAGMPRHMSCSCDARISELDEFKTYFTA